DARKTSLFAPSSSTTCRVLHAIASTSPLSSRHFPKQALRSSQPQNLSTTHLKVRCSKGCSLPLLNFSPRRADARYRRTCAERHSPEAGPILRHTATRTGRKSWPAERYEHG